MSIFIYMFVEFGIDYNCMHLLKLIKNSCSIVPSQTAWQRLEFSCSLPNATDASYKSRRRQLRWAPQIQIGLYKCPFCFLKLTLSLKWSCLSVCHLLWKTSSDTEMQHESNSTYSQYWKILRKTVGCFISDMLIIGKTWNKVLRQFALTYCWLSVGPDQNFFATVDQTSGFLKLPPPSSTICPTAPHKETTSLILTLPTIHQPPNNPPTIQQPSSLQHIIMQQSVPQTTCSWWWVGTTNPQWAPNLTLKLFFLP